MKKKIGLVWLKDDFRLKKNLALIEATKKHDKVVAFYLYKEEKYLKWYENLLELTSCILSILKFNR